MGAIQSSINQALSLSGLLLQTNPAFQDFAKKQITNKEIDKITKERAALQEEMKVHEEANKGTPDRLKYNRERVMFMKQDLKMARRLEELNPLATTNAEELDYQTRKQSRLNDIEALQKELDENMIELGESIETNEDWDAYDMLVNKWKDLSQQAFEIEPTTARAKETVQAKYANDDIRDIEANEKAERAQKQAQIEYQKGIEEQNRQQARIQRQQAEKAARMGLGFSAEDYLAAPSLLKKTLEGGY